MNDGGARPRWSGAPVVGCRHVHPGGLPPAPLNVLASLVLVPAGADAHQPECQLDGEALGTTALDDVPVASGTRRVIFIAGAQRKAMLVVGVSGRDERVSPSFRSPREKMGRPRVHRTALRR